MNEWSQSNQDRAAEVWATMVGMYGNRFTRDFGDSVPEPWKQAIKYLKDPELQRGFRRLANGGSPHPPNLPEFVKLCRDPSDHADGGAAPPDPACTLPGPRYDHFHCFGAKQFFKFLRTHNVPNEALPKMIQRTNEILDAARADPEMRSGDERKLGKELHEILWAAWSKVLAEFTQAKAPREAA